MRKRALQPPLISRGTKEQNASLLPISVNPKNGKLVVKVSSTVPRGKLPCVYTNRKRLLKYIKSFNFSTFLRTSGKNSKYSRNNATSKTYTDYGNDYNSGSKPTTVRRPGFMAVPMPQNNRRFMKPSFEFL